MERLLNEMVASLKKLITKDLSLGKENPKVVDMLLDAYNRYQLDERDGVDYLYNLFNKEDLKKCIDNGLSVSDIAWLYDQTSLNTTSFFYFGVNHEEPEPIANFQELKNLMVNWLCDFLPCVVAYPYLKEYQAIYKRYVTDLMTTEGLVH